MVQALLRPTPFGKLAYVPRGPALADGAALSSFLPLLHRACRQAGAFMLKLEPPWPDAPEAVASLRAQGFRRARRSIQPSATVLVDLSGSEEDWLRRMHPKTRYNIRLALRRGVQIRHGTLDDVPAFYALLEETAQRDGFGIHPLDYYKQAFSLFWSNGMAALVMAEHAGKTLAAAMIFLFAGVASYFYGGSASTGRDLMPSYAVQWAAMLWAKQQGAHLYDLWGIPDEVGQNPEAYMKADCSGKGGLWGVWRFKRGFGGRVLRLVGSWDYVYRPAGYLAYMLYDRFRVAKRG
jgi:peptidoglycan pentaglycine glycine transferase (the first glycine)